MSVPSQKQLSLRAVVLSVLLAMVLAAANTYLGLFAGLTIATAIPAAVVSMAVLRVLGGGSILENNIVQTGASAGSSIAAGVIFTLPALVLLGYWQDFRYGWVLAIAGLGGLLGVLFSVPLRRSMIVENPLPFPEGKAAAEVLKAGENPGPGLRLLGFSAALGALVKLAAESGLRIIPDNATVAGFLGKYLGYMGTNLSPALLGVGYIIGLNIGIVVLLGSVLSYNIAIPLYHALAPSLDPALAAQLTGLAAADAASLIRAEKIRFLGVGAMLVGGMWTLFSLRGSLLSGIRSGIAAARKGTDEAVPETERDLPMKWMLIALVLFVIPLLVLYQAIVHDWLVSVPMALIMVVAGFLFASVSAYLAGLVGSSNNPVSGITIATILFASAVLVLLLGADSPIGGGGRQPAGSEGRLSGGCHALEAAVDARHRSFFLRVGDGAGAEPAGGGLRHRAGHGRASQFSERAAGDADGLRGAGHVRRRLAVGHDRIGWRAGRADHRGGCLAESARLAVPRTGAGRSDRHLPAARTDGADFPRWRTRAPCRAPPRCRGARRGCTRHRTPAGHVVLGGAHHR